LALILGKAGIDKVRDIEGFPVILIPIVATSKRQDCPVARDGSIYIKGVIIYSTFAPEKSTRTKTASGFEAK
jgi:hypothetical protein